jgi:hypothetical protein
MQQVKNRERRVLAKLVTTVGLVAGILTLLLSVTCGGPPVSPTLEPKPTPAPTPTPQAIKAIAAPTVTVTGKWDRIIQVGETQAHANVTVTILRAAIATPKGLLPDHTPDQIKFRGLDEAVTILGVAVKVDNKTGKDVSIYPGGIGAKVLVGNEQSEPAFFASQIGGELLNGAVEEFQVLFPLKRTPPDTVRSFRYKFDAISHTFDFQIDLGQ